jgi:hypothetical protein
MKQNSVLLYSKFSQCSKDFIELLKETNNQYKCNLDINLVCIDNELLRKKVMQSKEIDIESVPCLLILNNTSLNSKTTTIDKYEGNDCFAWLTMLREQKEQEKQEQIQLLKQELNFLANEENSSQIHRKTETEDSESPLLHQQIGELTNIDDLKDEEENETELYDLKTNNYERGESNVSSKTENKKKTNLLASAMEMQKLREMEEQQISQNRNGKA